VRGARDLKTKRSRRFRLFSTKAELKLWNHLRSHALDGCKFIRQHPIGPFIADFVCRERRLIIEVDGGQHALNERDRSREQWLVERGYSVLRFWNNEVLENIEGVLEAIKFALAETPPHPNRFAVRPLPARGER
jgi:very-short-patch-repair endonuclease